MVVLFIHSSYLGFNGFFVQFCSTNNPIRGIPQLRCTVFIGVVMRTVGSHKMMLVGRCKNIISCCTKSKVVKRKFEDQEDTERASDADAAFSGALNAAQTLCLNSASLWRGVWCLTWLLPLLRLRGGRALRRLWMPLQLRLRLRMTIES